jgi:glycosidase
MRSGTFRTAMERLPAVADMGFDVVYLPPIHPIGRVNRKGPNTPEFPGGKPHDIGEHDPGSPWAIGSDEGGHDAVHPDLGTLADFRAFVRAARAEGVEVALDLALQAAPDHPWVAAHPEWFTTRVDGTIAYAESAALYWWTTKTGSFPSPPGRAAAVAAAFRAPSSAPRPSRRTPAALPIGRSRKDVIGR